METTEKAVTAIELAKELAEQNYKVGKRIVARRPSALDGLFFGSWNDYELRNLYVEAKGLKDVQSLLQGFYVYTVARASMSRDDIRGLFGSIIGSDVLPIKTTKPKSYDVVDVLEHLENATSRETYRPSLKYIYKDESYFVATDGFRMYTLRDTLPLSDTRPSGYYQFIGDTLTDKKLDEKFPPWRNVIPSINVCTLHARLTVRDIIALHDKCKAYLDLCKVIAKYGSFAGLVSYFDELQDIRTDCPELAIASDNVLLTGICFNAKYLVDALAYLVRYAIAHNLESVNWYVDSDQPNLRASIFCGTDSVPAVLIMPCRASNATLAELDTLELVTV